MRVTSNLMFKTGAGAMQNKQQELLRVQEQSLSGLRTNRPSDDPAGIFRHVLFSSNLSGVQSLKRTTDFASQRLSLADGHINSVHEDMLRAQDLALKLSNNDVEGNPNILKSASEEAQALYHSILKTINSEMDGVPLFGGGRTRSPYDEIEVGATVVRVQADGKGPLTRADTGFSANVAEGSSVADLPLSVKVRFLAASGEYQVNVNGIEQQPVMPTGTPPTVDVGNGITLTTGGLPKAGDVFYFEVVPTYRGGAEDRPVQVLNGQTLPGNVLGSDILEGTGDLGRDISVLGTLAGLRGALLRADSSEIAVQIDRIREGRAQISDHQAVTGIRTTLVDSVHATLELDETSLQEATAANVEADLFEVLSRLEQTSQSMQVMTVTEREVLNTSLIDFIR